jgi:hypothetical protein
VEVLFHCRSTSVAHQEATTSEAAQVQIQLGLIRTSHETVSATRDNVGVKRTTGLIAVCVNVVGASNLVAYTSILRANRQDITVGILEVSRELAAG